MKTPFTTSNSKQAILAFKGDVYQGLDAESLQNRANLGTKTCENSQGYMGS